MFENGLGKKRVLVISLLFAAVLLLLFHQVIQPADPAVQSIGFIFIFIAFIAFFPLPIRHSHPVARLLVLARQNRAPPSIH
jgi:hypothetical protein